MVVDFYDCTGFYQKPIPLRADQMAEEKRPK